MSGVVAVPHVVGGLSEQLVLQLDVIEFSLQTKNPPPTSGPSEMLPQHRVPVAHSFDPVLPRQSRTGAPDGHVVAHV